MLIESVRILRDADAEFLKDKGFEIRLVGYGYSESEYRALVDSYGLGEFVKFLGRMEGESLVAEGLIRAGAGYGIYAGLNVQRDAWEASAQVRARQRPTELLSGCWVA